MIIGAIVATIALQAQSVRKSALLDSAQLLADLRTLSSDEMEGRAVGMPGSAKARAYLVRRFKESGLAAISESYEHPFTFAGGRGATAAERQGVNVIGRIDAAGKSPRSIVITAHYDHLGIRNGQIYNGANDNASGTAALMALAKFFRANRPQNAFVFAALDAEEVGLRGADAFLKKPPIDRANIVMNVNLDMIGRDPDDKLFAAGTYHYPFLKPYVEKVAATAPVKLMAGHDNPQQKGIEDWTRDSDHYPFHLAGIPFIYLGVEDYANHHKPADDYETMTHDFYVRAVETALRLLQTLDANLQDIEKRARSK